MRGCRARVHAVHLYSQLTLTLTPSLLSVWRTARNSLPLFFLNCPHGAGATPSLLLVRPFAAALDLVLWFKGAGRHCGVDEDRAGSSAFGAGVCEVFWTASRRPRRPPHPPMPLPLLSGPATLLEGTPNLRGRPRQAAGKALAGCAKKQQPFSHSSLSSRSPAPALSPRLLLGSYMPPVFSSAPGW